jgi:hypothetical protein
MLLLLQWCVLITSLSVVTLQLSLFRWCHYSATAGSPLVLLLRNYHYSTGAVTLQLLVLPQCCYSAGAVTPQLPLLCHHRYSIVAITHYCCYSLLSLHPVFVTPSYLLLPLHHKVGPQVRLHRLLWI